mmetsp:Transcript_49969/g.144947  ORF Transcript_49969/g.144947 Transcript_49969/m.144947 type:complete len:234 (+) Transcript_49969:91-792(+)
MALADRSMPPSLDDGSHPMLQDFKHSSPLSHALILALPHTHELGDGNFCCLPDHVVLIFQRFLHGCHDEGVLSNISQGQNCRAPHQEVLILHVGFEARKSLLAALRSKQSQCLHCGLSHAGLLILEAAGQVFKIGLRPTLRDCSQGPQGIHSHHEVGVLQAFKNLCHGGYIAPSGHRGQGLQDRAQHVWLILQAGTQAPHGLRVALAGHLGGGTCGRALDVQILMKQVIKNDT